MATPPNLTVKLTIDPESLREVERQIAVLISRIADIKRAAAAAETAVDQMRLALEPVPEDGDVEPGRERLLVNMENCILTHPHDGPHWGD